MNTLIIILTQTINIEEKINNAPDSNYATGVLIGSLIPFICLAIIAYGIYYYNKIKK